MRPPRPVFQGSVPGARPIAAGIWTFLGRRRLRSGQAKRHRRPSSNHRRSRRHAALGAVVGWRPGRRQAAGRAIAGDDGRPVPVFVVGGGDVAGTPIPARLHAGHGSVCRRRRRRRAPDDRRRPASDWLQGPYVYELYREYGYDQGQIATLFVAGFGSSMIAGTVVGSLADTLCVVVRSRAAGNLASGVAARRVRRGVSVRRSLRFRRRASPSLSVSVVDARSVVVAVRFAPAPVRRRFRRRNRRIGDGRACRRRSSSTSTTTTTIFRGRKFCCQLFCVLYAAACVAKRWPSFALLILGRLLSGVSTSILYSSFGRSVRATTAAAPRLMRAPGTESWLVKESATRQVAPGALSATFAKTTMVNGIVAIASGVVANVAYDALGPIGPFDVAAGVLLVRCVRVRRGSRVCRLGFLALPPIAAVAVDDGPTSPAASRRSRRPGLRTLATPASPCTDRCGRPPTTCARLPRLWSWAPFNHYSSRPCTSLSVAVVVVLVVVVADGR